jgi:hypothetical protein
MAGPRPPSLAFAQLSPRAFLAAALAIYLAGAASHLLTAPEIVARGGLWFFAALQALLTCLWFFLHAARLRAAGRSIAIPAGVSVVYALSVVLLVVLAAAFYRTLTDQVPENAATALGLIMIIVVIGLLLGSPHYDLAAVAVVILTFAAFVPVLCALAVTVEAVMLPPAAAKA